MSHALLGCTDPDRWTTTELLLHAIPVSEWQSDFAWCASYLMPSGKTLLDHIVVVNYRANVPLASCWRSSPGSSGRRGASTCTA